MYWIKCIFKFSIDKLLVIRVLTREIPTRGFIQIIREIIIALWRTDRDTKILSWFTCVDTGKKDHVLWLCLYCIAMQTSIWFSSYLSIFIEASFSFYCCSVSNVYVYLYWKINMQVMCFTKQSLIFNPNVQICIYLREIFFMLPKIRWHIQLLM